MIRFVFVFAMLVSISLIAYAAFSHDSEKKREEALATIQKPASIIFYERLIAKRSGIQLDGPIANEEVEGTPYAGLSDTEIEERLDMWAGLLERHDAELKADEEWQAVVEILKKPAEALTSEEWALMTRQAQVHEDLILAIRAAAGRGGPVYPMDHAQPYEADGPHLARMREFARLLSVHSSVSGKAEEYDEAAEDIVAILNLEMAMNGEGLIINALVRGALRVIAIDTIAESFAARRMSPEITNRLFQRLSTLNDRNNFREALIGETILGIAVFEYVRTTGWSMARNKEFKKGGVVAASLRSFLLLIERPAFIPMFDLDESAFVECMDRLIRAALLPYNERTEIVESLEEYIDELPEARKLTPILFPALIRALTAQARHEAQTDVTRLGIAVEDWYREHGSYPDSLQQIAYWFDGELPLDPFTGDAYRYVVSDDSFVLYSLGVDIEDDGGRHDLVDGDIVWRGVEETN
ncbi:MAG: hypothetical protein IID08_01980 [Candidatus Hydrogenedentes bacterium]|nr:hypothetical protein [Candidatus Hydrogenedentota bacterium]